MCVLKLLLGGSPCVYWSGTQAKNRETRPEGKGWNLFQNFVTAREKFRPDFFLFENNRSVSRAVRDGISECLGVQPVAVNSALVSAQNRERLYWTNIPGVCQPEDRGIHLRDILDSGLPLRDKGYTLKASYAKASAANAVSGGHFPATMAAEPVTAFTTDRSGRSFAEYGGRPRPVYEVRFGQIQVCGRRYPISLPDGFYILRKLSVRECMRLQTIPDWFRFPVSDTQAYHLIGNAWTAEVIVHILRFVPGITEEPLTVLSMYDGMACAHIALTLLGARIVHYYAAEIDPYAIRTSAANFPEIVHLGDAFQVRARNWMPPG